MVRTQARDAVSFPDHNRTNLEEATFFDAIELLIGLLDITVEWWPDARSVESAKAFVRSHNGKLAEK